MEDINKKLLVNGPSNCIRLANNKMNKALYIFINVESSMQLECKDPDSKNFISYLDKNFRKTDNVLDFFFQTMPVSENAIERNEILKSKNNNIVTKIWKSDYGSEGYDYFLKIFNRNNSKVRAHYFYVSYLVNHIMEDLENFDKVSYTLLHKDFPPSATDYKLIDDRLKTLFGDILYFKMLIFGEDSEKEKIKFNDNEIRLIKYFTKIKKFTSSNKNVRIFDDVYENISGNIENILSIIDNLFNSFHELSEHYNQYTRMTLNKYNRYTYVSDKTYELMDMNNNNVSLLIEKCRTVVNEISHIYFVRRYIEKDYITHGILYALDEASLKILYILINKFDFKITNIFHIATSVDDFENKMKKTRYNDYKFNEVAQIILPKEFSQCIDMKGFPKLFK